MVFGGMFYLVRPKGLPLPLTILITFAAHVALLFCAAWFGWWQPKTHTSKSWYERAWVWAWFWVWALVWYRSERANAD